jgi:hypothetical protein
MSADARIATGLPAHPKTKKLIRRLGDGAGWRLVCLFLWAAANRSDGDLSGLTAEDIELAVDWPGDAGQFVSGLVSVGFLDGDEGSYQIHDWSEHNPWAAGADARSEKAKWAAVCKQHGRIEAARIMPEYASRLLAARQESTDSAPETAASLLSAVLDSASSTPLATFSCAPSPSPSPSPSPFQEQEQKTLSANADAVDENSTSVKSDEPRRLIPVTAILAAYHANLPMLPAVRQMTDSRKRKLKQRWLEDAERQTPEYWAKFFAYVATSDFLSGRDGRWTGCNFEWLIEGKNHLKVVEGQYENRSAA